MHLLIFRNLVQILGCPDNLLIFQRQVVSCKLFSKHGGGDQSGTPGAGSEAQGGQRGHLPQQEAAGHGQPLHLGGQGVLGGYPGPGLQPGVSSHCAARRVS